MADAVHEIHGDQEAIAQLAAQVQRLKQDAALVQPLNGATGGGSAGSVAAQPSSTELQAAQAKIAALKAELLQERRNRKTGFAAQLPPFRGVPAAQQQGQAVGLGQPGLDGVQEGPAQWPTCATAVTAQQQGPEAENASMQPEQQAALLTTLQQQLAEAAAEREELLGRVEAAEALAAKASDKEAALSKGRADLKVHA